MNRFIHILHVLYQLVGSRKLSSTYSFHLVDLTSWYNLNIYDNRSKRNDFLHQLNANTQTA